MLFKKKFNYNILDADGHVIAEGFRCHLADIHDTFEDMKPAAKKCVITRGTLFEIIE